MEQSTTSTTASEGPSAFAISFIIFLAITAILIIFGNGLVILTWICQRSVRSHQNAYFLSLAFVDLLVGVFLVPMLTSNVLYGKWLFGPSLCRAYLLNAISLSMVSTLHLIAIAVDRYRATLDGLSYVMKRSYYSVFEKVLMIWVIAIWMGLPLILNDENILKYSANGICTSSKKDPSWTIHFMVGTYIIPLVVLVNVYLKLYREIQRRSRDRTNIGNPSGDRLQNPPSLDTESEDIIEETILQVPKTPETVYFGNFENFWKLKGRIFGPGTPELEIPRSQVQEFVQKKITLSLNKERRAAKTLLIIIGAYTISWLPFAILYGIIGFLPKGDQETLPKLVKFLPILLSLGYLNSAMNPFIYAKRSKEFRKGFAKTLCFWKK